MLLIFVYLEFDESLYFNPKQFGVLEVFPPAFLRSADRDFKVANLFGKFKAKSLLK